jgi:uncharacterized protein
VAWEIGTVEIELSRLLQAAEVTLAEQIELSDAEKGLTGSSLAAEGIRFPDPVRFEGRARATGGCYSLEGRVTGRVGIQCSRCATAVDHELDLEFAVRVTTEALGSGQDAMEFDETDEGAQVPKTEMDVSWMPEASKVLPVDALVREQVLLDLPIRPLCRQDCKGLCPECGTDLNDKNCGCERAGEGSTDPRLAPLLELKKKFD